jgi:HTH-type transcriptional regulator / antitoxin HigA
MKNTLEISAIRSEVQYKRYLVEVDKLMDNDPVLSSEDGKLLDTLVILIEAYERKKGWELPSPENPLEVIKTRMEDLGLKQTDLIEAMGDKSVVSKILSGTRKLTYSMIAPLSQLLKVPAELLLEKSK